MFFRSVIESHAAQCAGLYDDDTCDPSRVTCNMCGQKFGQENILQHTRYCGEVVVQHVSTCIMFYITMPFQSIQLILPRNCDLMNLSCDAYGTNKTLTLTWTFRNIYIVYVSYLNAHCLVLEGLQSCRLTLVLHSILVYSLIMHRAPDTLQNLDRSTIA